MSSLLYLNQALRFASHTSRLAVMIDSDATSVSGGDVLFLVMTCFAILGAGQLVIWIMNCPFSFGKQSQDKANTGTQEDDDEGVLVGAAQQPRQRAGDLLFRIAHGGSVTTACQRRFPVRASITSM